jgi:hypothetical protein
MATKNCSCHKKKKGKNKKKQTVQKAKPIGPFNYASSAPLSSPPLHTQIPTKSHYNRTQEANLSTLVGTEAELKQSREREKTLNSMLDTTVNNLKNSRAREEALQSFYKSNISNSQQKTPLKQHKKPETLTNNNLSPIPLNDETSGELFSSAIKGNSLNAETITMRKNNIKADILLQKQPTPDNDSNNSLYISSESESSPNKYRPNIAHKKVTIMEESQPVASVKNERSITVGELRRELKNKGFPVSYQDESGKKQMFSKEELLQRFNFVELEKKNKRDNEKKTKRNENDDEHYIESIFPSKNETSFSFNVLKPNEENSLSSLFENLNVA